MLSWNGTGTVCMKEIVFWNHKTIKLENYNWVYLPTIVYIQINKQITWLFISTCQSLRLIEMVNRNKRVTVDGVRLQTKPW